MRSLYYPDWNQLELRDFDPPEPAKGEVLIRVAACGVCGSEIETFVNRSPRRTPPLIMGHEFCGVVETIGQGVEESEALQRGSSVVSNAVLNCGRCVACENGRSNLCVERQIFGMHRPGAFAELVAAPADSLFRWPEGVSAEAACLAEPLGNGVHVSRLLRDVAPRVVLIVGAGSIGLMCMQAIKYRFPDAMFVVADVDTTRLDVAARLGADRIVKSGEDDLRSVLRSTVGHPHADVVVDAAGSAVTKQLSIESCRPGGTIVWIGLGEDTINLHSYDLTLNEKAVLGSYGATPSDMQEALRLMETGDVDVSSWVTTFKPSDWVQGFKRQLDPATRDVKAVLVN
jgi:threonine dehydrogenase-like Zn-dependent dehydrogenase